MITNYNKLKKSPNIKNIKQTGFTLAETLLVTVLVGIFAAMGTPSWMQYVANQRLNNTNEELYNILVKIQEKAQKESLSYTVELKQPNNLSPQYRYYPKDDTTVDNNNPPWQNLSKDNEFKLVLNDGSKLIFDYQGKIDNSSEIITNEKIILAFQNTSQTAQKCILVKTKFGYLYTTSDANCQ